MDCNGRVWKMKSELRPAKTWLGSDLPGNSLRFLRIPWDLLGIPWDCLRVFRRFLRISLGILQDSLGFPFGYQQRRMYCLRLSATNSTPFAPDKCAPVCQFPGVCQLPTAKGSVRARHLFLLSELRQHLLPELRQHLFMLAELRQHVVVGHSLSQPEVVKIIRFGFESKKGTTHCNVFAHGLTLRRFIRFKCILARSLTTLETCTYTTAIDYAAEAWG